MSQSSSSTPRRPFRSRARRLLSGDGSDSDSRQAPPESPKPSRWPAFPPPGYLGQLDPVFQARLAAERQDLTRDDCDWYHTSVLRDGAVIPGAWDLRGGEAAYLGATSFTGTRVLELGPASGYLTFFMEEAGAEVICLEAGFDVSIDLLPVPGVDMAWHRMETMRYVDRVQNSWWYVHRNRASRARMVFADIYAMPGDLGTFDVSVFGAILLHLRNPFTAIEQAAQRTARRIVVTDLIQDPDIDPEANVMRFDPLGSAHHSSNWWSMTPGAVGAMLRRLGFTEVEVTYHTQRHHLGHRLEEPAVDMSMFTIVGDRP